MQWDWYMAQILARLTEVIPWLLGGLVGLGVFSFSPLGREALRHLRSKRADSDLAEATLQELTDVRQLLGEIAERLDATERHLTQLAADPSRPPYPLLGSPEPPPEDRSAITPH